MAARILGKSSYGVGLTGFTMFVPECDWFPSFFLASHLGGMSSLVPFLRFNLHAEFLAGDRAPRPSRLETETPASAHAYLRNKCPPFMRALPSLVPYFTYPLE